MAATRYANKLGLQAVNGRDFCRNETKTNRRIRRKERIISGLIQRGRVRLYARIEGQRQEKQVSITSGTGRPLIDRCVKGDPLRRATEKWREANGF